MIDLTHSFTDNMPVYPGDPMPSLKQVASIDKEGYTDHLITTGMHIGTHMDAPLHMIKNGKKIDEIPPERCIGNGVLIDATKSNKVDTSLLKGLSIKEGSIVLVYTGFGSNYRKKSYFKNYPLITEDFARKMVELKVKIVGMDTPGPDEPPYPIHKILLGKVVLILENLTNLDQLLNIKHFEVMALPAKFHTDAAPVRVIVRIRD